MLSELFFRFRSTSAALRHSSSLRRQYSDKLIAASLKACPRFTTRTSRPPFHQGRLPGKFVSRAVSLWVFAERRANRPTWPAGSSLKAAGLPPDEADIGP